ncbi:MAG: MATE family efflux transporter [Lachnospiraceae bacterium]
MKIKLSDQFTYKRLLRFVMPTIFMMIVTSLYGIVDGWFVSNIIGKNAFAAVNLIMPVLMAGGSFGYMIGTGGAALVSKTLGEEKKKEAHAYFSMLINLVILIGFIISVVGFIFMPNIVYSLGASEHMAADAVLYGRILVVATIFYMLQNTFHSFLVVAELPKMGLIVSLCTGITNIIFDFLLVYLFSMGIAGAAIATVISQMVGAVVPLCYFICNKKGILKLVITKFDFEAIRKACMNGFSEMISNMSMSIVGILYNFQLLKIAAEDGVAAYGVIMYVNFIFMGFFFGYSIGITPIIGYNYGAGNKKELKNIIKKSMVITVILSISMTTIAIVFSKQLASIFVGYDNALMELTKIGLIQYSLSFLICGFNIFASAMFTALDNGVISASISFLRTLVIQVVAVLILPIFLGINGIWLAIATAELITVIITVYFFMKNKKIYGY